MIEICHLHSIQVYAWVELPHVSEKFWTEHPEWRERTGLLGDAHLDWRKLMNLQSRDCFREVERGLRQLASRFDWDGINMAELYFESLEGYRIPLDSLPSTTMFAKSSRKLQASIRLSCLRLGRKTLPRCDAF